MIPPSDATAVVTKPNRHRVMTSAYLETRDLLIDLYQPVDPACPCRLVPNIRSLPHPPR